MISKLKSRWESVPLQVKVSTSYAVCSVLQKCLSFITLPLFTRLLTQEQYGQYTIYTSWSGMLSIVLTLNLAYGSFSTAMVKFEDRRDEYISSVQGICLLLSAVFLVIYLPFSKMWNQLFELPTPLILVMMLDILGSTAILLWSGKKRFEYQYKSVVFQTLLYAVLAPCVALILVLNTEEKGYARIAGYAATAILIGGYLFILNAYRGKKLFNREFWNYAFRFNLPLLAYYASQTVFNQSDRIMISHMCGTDKAAVYGVAHNLALILTFVLNAINNSYVPWAYGKIKAGQGKDNQKIASGIAVLMSILLLAIIWFAPEIILIMAGKQYLEAVWVVAPVAMSLLLLFYAQLFINVEFYYEEKKQLVFASIGAAVVNIILNYALILQFGYVAAGYTTLFSYIVFAVSNCLAMKKILKARGLEDSLYSYRQLILIAIVFAAAGFLGVALYQFLLVRMLAAVAVLVVAVIYRKKLLAVFSKIRK